MSRQKVVLWALAVGLVGCGGPTANNAQVTQIMQEARSDLKTEPGYAPQRTLNLTQGAQKAAGEPDDPRRAMDPLLETDSGITEADSTELDAIALAQDGTLALARGEDANGEAKLEASIAMYPTLDALRAMAPRLAARGELERLGGLCAATLDLAREAQRFDVLETCRDARADDAVRDALSWATPMDRDFYEQERARRGAPQ